MCLEDTKGEQLMISKTFNKFIYRVLVVTFFMFFVLAAFTHVKIKAYSLGDGTAANPFLISTPEELNEVRNNLDKCFKQTADIDLSGYPNWEPIGKYGSEFKGNYDGNGHIISNLTSNNPSLSAVGLFGYVTGSGNIKNLGIKDANITGLDYVGALVGQYYGVGGIERCYSIGNVQGRDYVGNLIGMNATGVQDCYSIGSVQGRDYIGGLVGQNYGGLVSKSFSSVKVIGNSYTGGVVGISNDDTYIKNCYYDLDVSLQIDSSKGTPLSYSEMRKEGSFIGFDFSTPVWLIDENISFPSLYWKANPPTVGDYSFSTEYETTIGDKVTGSDLDDDKLTYTLNVNCLHGTVNVNSDGTWSYTPSTGFSGNDVFKVGVSDGRGGTAESTISLLVKTPPPPPVTNNPPTVGDYSFTTEYETTIGDKVSGSDVDGDTLTYALTISCLHGTVNVNSDGTWSYTPSTGYSGSDEFKVGLSDGKGGIAESTISIVVKAKAVLPSPPPPPPPAVTNNPPEVGNSSYTTEYETTIGDKVTGSDLDGDTLTYSLNVNCLHGTVLVNSDGTWSYAPSTGYSGSDEFKVGVSDGKGGMAESIISIFIKTKVVLPSLSPVVSKIIPIVEDNSEYILPTENTSPLSNSIVPQNETDNNRQQISENNGKADDRKSQINEAVEQGKNLPKKNVVEKLKPAKANKLKQL